MVSSLKLILGGNLPLLLDLQSVHVFWINSVTALIISFPELSGSDPVLPVKPGVSDLRVFQK